MKASIKQYRDNNNIILSIGMIIKNEEKVLRRCLDSLKPILHSLSCELIIADTGSEDKSVEIAREYTDKVYNFEWVDDFATARNFTIDKSQGKWYMYIDADEYFDDTVWDIVKFFNIPEFCDNYNTIEYTIRSYHNVSNTEFSETCVPRIYRQDNQKIRFVGKIHETIEINEPCGILPVVLHHTGYCYENEEQRERKKVRNLNLLKEEYKREPDNQRIVCHMIDVVRNDPEQCQYYVERAEELLAKESRTNYSPILFMQIADYYSEKDHEKVLSVVEAYFDSRENYDKYIITVAIYYLKAKALFSAEKYDESYDCYLNYIKMIEKYKKDLLDTTEMSAHSIEGVTDRDFCVILTIASEKFAQVSLFDYAKQLMDYVAVKELKGEDLKYCASVAFRVYSLVSEFDKIKDVYDILSISNDDRYINFANNELDRIYWLLSSEDKILLSKSLSEVTHSTNYSEMMKLCLSEYCSEKRLKQFLRKTKDDSFKYTEVIFQILKNKIDISDILNDIEIRKMCSLIEEVSEKHDNFAEVVYNYEIPDGYFNSIRSFYWLVSLYYEAACRASKLEVSEKYEIYRRFIFLLGDYITNIYNHELLNDEDVEVLPDLHRFGYYMIQANKALEAGDSIGYIRSLKKALVSCESMKELVQFFMEQFKKEF